MSALAALILRCESNPVPLSKWETDYLDQMRAWRGRPTPRQVAILNRIANRLAPAEISLMLSERMEDVALELMGDRPTYRQGNSIRYGNRFSLSIEVKGNKRGTWCAHDDDRKGGGALGLIAYVRGRGNADAIAWAKKFLGISDGGPLPEKLAHVAQVSPAPEPKKTIEIARQIWKETQPAKGSLVETYLASRGLTLPNTGALRFHPACLREKERLPAMVALMTDPVTGDARGIHRTYLQADGSGKADGNAKMMLGNVGVIRLTPDEDVTTGLGITEGIETGLSIIQMAGWSPVWAATSAGAISTFPVLGGVECLTIFGDADAAGDKAARACAARWTEAGREVVVHRAPGGQDWNDVGVAA